MQKRTFKTLAFLTAVSGVINAYAVAPGFYIGLMGGPATNDGGTQQAQVLNSPTTTPANPKSQQVGTRIFMGYKVNQYAGAEGGLTYFSTIKYTTNDNVTTCGVTNDRVRDFDFVGKVSAPLGKSFDVFGKAGAALVYETPSGALTPNFKQACGDSNYTTHFRPTYSIGASYDLSQSWVADISLNRVQVSGKVNNMTMFAIGLSYHFVDVYCGQFLCA